jgi:hypothetical protein
MPSKLRRPHPWRANTDFDPDRERPMERAPLFAQKKRLSILAGETTLARGYSIL